MPTGTILVVDDEPNIRRALRMVLEPEGYALLDADSAEAARFFVDGEAVDHLLLGDDPLHVGGDVGGAAAAAGDSKPRLVGAEVLVLGSVPHIDTVALFGRSAHGTPATH